MLTGVLQVIKGVAARAFMGRKKKKQRHRVVPHSENSWLEQTGPQQDEAGGKGQGRHDKELGLFFPVGNTAPMGREGTLVGRFYQLQGGWLW